MDIFHEQLVKHHRTAGDYVKIVGIIVGALLLFLILVVAVPVLVGSAVGMLSSICLLVGVAVLFCAYYLIVNTEDEFMSNQNLRLALAYAIDKQALIDTVYQNDNQPMTSFTPPAIMGANDSSFQEALVAERGEMYPGSGDLEKAQEYLQAALE